jgi:WD40 repeat protein
MRGKAGFRVGGQPRVCAASSSRGCKQGPGFRKGPATNGAGWMWIALAAAVAGLAGCAAKRPAGELGVRGHVRSLTTSGAALAAEFVDNNTYIWDWGDLTKAPQVCARKGHCLALLGPRHVITEAPSDPLRLQPMVVALELPSGRVVRRWFLGADWYCSDFCNSFNGRYVGVLLEEGRPTGGDTCLGIIGPGTQEIPWVPARGRVVKLTEDGIAISNDGRCLALLGLGDLQMLTAADLSRKKLSWRRSVPHTRSLAFSPDGSMLYVGGHSGILALQAADGHEVSTWSIDDSRSLGAPVARVVASPDSRFLAAGTDLPDGRVYLLDARSGRLVTGWRVAGKGDGGSSSWSIRPTRTLIEGLAFSPGGRLLATADSLSQSIRIWEVPRATAPKGQVSWLRRQ